MQKLADYITKAKEMKEDFPDKLRKFINNWAGFAIVCVMLLLVLMMAFSVVSDAHAEGSILVKSDCSIQQKTKTGMVTLVEGIHLPVDEVQPTKSPRPSSWSRNDEPKYIEKTWPFSHIRVRTPLKPRSRVV